MLLPKLFRGQKLDKYSSYLSKKCKASYDRYLAGEYTILAFQKRNLSCIMSSFKELHFIVVFRKQKFPVNVDGRI